MDFIKKTFITPTKQQSTEGRDAAPAVTPPARSAATAPPADITKPSNDPDELPETNAAINALRNFEYNPASITSPLGGGINQGVPSVAPTSPPAYQYVMVTPPAPRTLESLETEAWPYSSSASPNPVSINRAREILAASLADVDCELPGADIHGHAWMVERDEDWDKRTGTGKVSAPTRPKLYEDSTDSNTQIAYYRKLDLHRVYMHLVVEGRKKLIEWFGKPMFVDMHVNKALPASTTPKAMLEHLAGTYAKPRHYRQHMAQVQKTFDAPLNPRRPVEEYYMRLQECQDDSRLLRRPFTDEQVMDKALEQFGDKHGSEARKAEARWNRAIDKGDYDETWKDFKQFWKEEIHDFNTIASAEAHHTTRIDDLTTRMNSMSVHVAQLEAENQTYREANSAQQVREAFQASMGTRRRPQDDEISALTGVISDLRSTVDRLSSDSTIPTSGTGSNATEEEKRRRELLANAKARPPDAYKDMNNGKGRQFKWYCGRCGVNCTHSTKGCYECTPDEKKAFALATTKNTLGGSTKFLDRYMKYQVDYNFDSL